MPPYNASRSSEFFALTQGRVRKALSPSEVLHWRRELRIHAAYRALFCDAAGALRPEAGMVLADLVSGAELDKVGSGLSAEKLRELHGRKTLLMYLINRIDRDAVRTDEIHKQMKESDRE